jgi:DNA-3-methyladenine glycosylase I
MPTRCEWAGDDPLMVAYHDREWGVPSHDDRHLFEMLTLEGAQAGLSWSTILRKREGYRDAFAEFDVERVARFSERRAERLLANPKIVRNRLKVASTIDNAACVRVVQKEFGSFDDYLWRLVDGTPIDGRRHALRDLPAETPLAGELSRDLKRRGFRFVGPTSCYSFMQAVGLVNDHVMGCFRYAELAASGPSAGQGAR